MKKLLTILLLAGACVAQTSRTSATQEGNNTFSGTNAFNGTIAVKSPGIVAPANSHFVFEGDSITYGLASGGGTYKDTSEDWPSIAMTHPWFSGRGTKYNYAVSGSKTTDVSARYSAVHALSPSVTGTTGYFFLLVGINDIANTSDSAATIYARIAAIWASAKADGYIVVAATIIGEEYYIPCGTADCETVRQTINASIRAANGSWDRLIDFDQALPDQSDTNLFYDGLHPTRTGAAWMGRLAANAMASQVVSSTYVAPSKNFFVRGFATVHDWLNVGKNDDIFHVFPQTAGGGVYVTSTNQAGNTYRPMGLWTEVINVQKGGDVLRLFPYAAASGAEIAATDSLFSVYRPFAITSSRLRVTSNPSNDGLAMYGFAAGSGAGIDSTNSVFGAFKPLTINASNWTVSNTGKATFNGGIQAGASGSTISDSRELIQNAHSCGTTTTCANTANGSNRIVFGNVALSSGTPSTAVVTGITAFTSTTSYVCTATNKTTAVNAVKVANTSTTSITITGPNTVTDSIDYICVGN